MNTPRKNGGPDPTPTAVMKLSDKRILAKPESRDSAVIDLLGEFPDGLIRHSIAKKKRYALSSVCSIVHRLAKAGLVVVTNDTRLSPYGHPATIVRLPRPSDVNRQRDQVLDSTDERDAPAATAHQTGQLTADADRQRELDSMPAFERDAAPGLKNNQPTDADRQREFGPILDSMPIDERDALASRCLSGFWLKRYQANPLSETVRLTLIDAMECELQVAP